MDQKGEMFKIFEYFFLLPKKVSVCKTLEVNQRLVFKTYCGILMWERLNNGSHHLSTVRKITSDISKPR